MQFLAQADDSNRLKPISAYSFTSFAWLSIQAVPLIVWPAFISSLLSEEYQPAHCAKPRQHRGRSWS